MTKKVEEQYILEEKAKHWDALQEMKKEAQERIAIKRRILARKIKEAGITVTKEEIDAEMGK